LIDELNIAAGELQSIGERTNNRQQRGSAENAEVSLRREEKPALKTEGRGHAPTFNGSTSDKYAG
jgi:hypothetical protein